MDYLPKPASALPGIDVPLLELIPLRSRPRTSSGPSAKTDWAGSTTNAELSKTAIVLEDIYERATPSGEEDLIGSTNVHQTLPPALSGHVSPQIVSPGLQARNTPDIEESLLHWHQFPSLYGLHDRMCPKDDKEIQALATLLQSWAFFGLLELIFDEVMTQAEWSDDGQRTDAPPVVRWPKRYLNRLEQRLERGISGSILLAVRKVELFCSDLERNSATRTASPIAQITLSIRILCETLGGPSGVDQQCINPYLFESMLQRGWCTHVLLQRWTLWSTRMYYLSMMRPPGRGRLDHDPCRAARNRCIAKNTAMGADYQTRHVSPDCQCEHVGVDSAQVAQIIAGGSIPLIRIEEKNDTIVLTLKRARPVDQYVAISHVWSDGLGNPASNALPRCQIKNLMRLIKRLPEPHVYKSLPGRFNYDMLTLRWIRNNAESVLVWMDTFCIPVCTDPQDDSIFNAKIEAINRMNSTYACADSVMVMDQELLDTRLGDTSELELYARIATASWTSRSWTYQESALASRCHFAFADASIAPLFFSKADDPNLPLYLYQLAGPRNVHKLLTEIRNDSQLRRRQMMASCDRKTARSMINQDSEMNENSPRTKSIFAVRLEQNFYSIVMQSFDNTTHIDFRHPAEERLAAFSVIWDTLCIRTSTYSSDTDLIFANMLGFSLSKLPGHGRPHPQRLQAILWHLELLPLGLLFNSGPRLDSKLHHHNRWVPTEVGDYALTSSCDLRQNNSVHDSQLAYACPMQLREGALWTQAEVAPVCVLMVLNSKIPRRRELYVQSAIDQCYVRLIAKSSETDAFDGENSGIVQTVGARLFVTSQRTDGGPNSQADTDWSDISSEHFRTKEFTTQRSVRLSTVYDCPLEVCVVSKACVPDDALIIAADDMTKMSYPNVAWKLKIQCDDFTAYVRQDPKPSFRHSSRGAAFLKMYRSPAWYYYLPIWLLTCVSMRILIASQLGWASTSSLYKASTVIFAIQSALVLSPMLGCNPLSEMLFIASRIRDNDVKPIDTAYTIISIILKALAWSHFHGALRAQSASSRANDARLPALQSRLETRSAWRWLMAYRAYRAKLWHKVDRCLLLPYEVALAHWQRFSSKRSSGTTADIPFD
ncbi:hypothetical protein AMS68_003741 [Peltaster fructicola]|uniref:Heterokaryon incompatibility domain-containing protein n=1 Tax=Peltaster fructicola TaxID=286661 RepID=A0A6H0XU16_9PEZI|nr:hypothetical protein AMS68_003741 [Peltaster fructicola]